MKIDWRSEEGMRRVKEMTRCKPIPETLNSVSNLLLQVPIPDRRMPGVYFCFRNGKLGYIGQSVDVTRRCFQHRDSGFNQFQYIPVINEKRRLKIETELIRYFEPESNGERCKWNHPESPRNDEEMIRFLTNEMLREFS